MNANVLTASYLETQAIVEALCDYFPCSYVNSPVVGKKLGRVLGLETDWIRNLSLKARLKEAEKNTYALGAVLSSALWELRSNFGQKAIDESLRVLLSSAKESVSLFEFTQRIVDVLVDRGVSTEAELKSILSGHGLHKVDADEGGRG